MHTICFLLQKTGNLTDTATILTDIVPSKKNHFTNFVLGKQIYPPTTNPIKHKPELL